MTGGGAVGLALRGSVLAGIEALDPQDATDATACAGFVAMPGPGGSVDSLGVDMSCGVGVATLAREPGLAPLMSLPTGDAGAVRTGMEARVRVPRADSPLLGQVECDAAWPTTDQRGLARPFPVGGRCDVGSVEVAIATAVPAAAPSDDGTEPVVPTQIRAGGGDAQHRPRMSIRR
jgi:hypothetical protein